MTVVIMAKCDDRGGPKMRPHPTLPETDLAGPWMIGACDTKLSGNYQTIDDGGIAKIQKAGFGSKWLLGYSGDPSNFMPVRERLTLQIGSFAGQYPDAHYLQAKAALEVSYQEHRLECIRAEILAGYGISSLDDLKANGKEQFDAKTLAQLWRDIRAYDIGIDLLLGGFDKYGYRHFFLLNHPGRAKHVQIGVGAAAIGSGQFHAEAFLYANYSPALPFNEAVACIMQAKMVADEAVPSVGQKTLLIAMRDDGSAVHLVPDSASRFRERWQAYRKNPPADMLATIELEELFNF